MALAAFHMFHTQSYRQRIETAQYRDLTRYRQPGRIVYIGLDYKLGAVKP